jgi:hypothetical protein
MDAAIIVGIGWCRWLEGVSARVSLVLVQGIDGLRLADGEWRQRLECGGLVEEHGNSDSLIVE